MLRTVSTLLLALLLCLDLAAEAAPGWQALAPGLEYRAAPLGQAPFPAMHQIRLDPKRMTLGLALAEDHGAPTLRVSTLRKAEKALAAVNASYFDAEGRPLGYLRDGDRLLVPEVATGAAFTGVLVLRSGGARILHRGAFQPGRAQLALQAGPRLVADGRPVQGLQGPARRRTGVAIDRKGRLLVFATDVTGDLTLAACRDFLLRAPGKGGVEPRDVLNLDGGSSTQMSLSVRGFKVDSPGLTAVPVALTVISR